MSVRNPLKIYVANVSREARERDLEKIFERVGRIVQLQFKGDFAFIEYEDEYQARDAIRTIDGHDLFGKRLAVQPYAYRGGDRRYRPQPGESGRPRYRIIIEGIDRSTSWQDVKDFARDIGRSVSFTDVYTRRGQQREGLVEFDDRADYEYALRAMKRSKINGVPVYLRPADGPGGRGGRGRSYSRSRSRSRGRGGYGGYRGGGGGYGGGDYRGRSRSRSRGGYRGSPRRYSSRSPRRSPPRRSSRSPRGYGSRSPPPRSPPRGGSRDRSPAPRNGGSPPPRTGSRSPPVRSPARDATPPKRSTSPMRDVSPRDDASPRNGARSVSNGRD